MKDKLSVSEILDALADALTNRDRDEDEDVVKYWISQLGTHRGMLMDRWLELILTAGGENADSKQTNESVN